MRWARCVPTVRSSQGCRAKRAGREVKRIRLSTHPENRPARKRKTPATAAYAMVRLCHGWRDRIMSTGGVGVGNRHSCRAVEDLRNQEGDRQGHEQVAGERDELAPPHPDDQGLQLVEVEFVPFAQGPRDGVRRHRWLFGGEGRAGEVDQHETDGVVLRPNKRASMPRGRLRPPITILRNENNATKNPPPRLARKNAP